MTSTPILTIIPARMQSLRLKRKMLTTIEGKSLIEWTWINAKRCYNLNQIVIATDDEELQEHIHGFGADVIMTKPDHSSGSARIQEVLNSSKYSTFDGIILNIQGDEPCVAPATISQTVQALMNTPKAQVATPIVQSSSLDDFQDPSIVKCVKALNGQALYFSRAPIPGSKASNSYLTFYQHVGIYAYRSSFLRDFDFSKQTPLRVEEDLEQLSILELSHIIQTVTVKETPLGVNIESDIPKVSAWINANLSL